MVAVDASSSKITKVVAKGIVKSFASTFALRGVDVTLSPGLTLIEGPNGSGKSTLLGILGTVVRPTSGSTWYEPLGDDVQAVRSELGWVSHETLAYPDLSGKQNIEFAARLQGIDPTHAFELAKTRFDLGSFVERPLRTCSRGQRQRIALARALVHAPSLLLLDEPTTGLDRSGVDRLFQVIRDEVARGGIVAVVSHEPDLFREDAVRRIVLDRGRLAREDMR